ncbi:TetR/AcrR family transcriptional regulator [Rhizorhabdus wittichii]|jgi:AcrR family transcriptional regulator|uniref:Transcriptional regulator, TetR family n=2 Tax=Rhizorhabdus wittichii TaxID=160791 RepID=A0A9J9HAG6_RHIWR|nr:TetR/AcrR family transcriptional regulator [Rhizorhabdus wittichii]ABQ68041.1 transcriptional regulator, TetR family [Rhizorhabdus wittichii RW1]ARR55053.1 TetR family transcriptional regulator [Rhizorhabdus wittichii DC-6]QTH21526.1 TetR/AcrR family transcriptional regulator [Rhizorhabdus wittichii]
MAKTAPATAPRKRGRPARKSNDVGRQALVDAARKVLTRVEPTLLTRQMVAEEAGVDPNLVRYYFGNIENLLMELVRAAHKSARAEMMARRIDSDPVERLRYRITRTFRLFHDNPYHHKLVSSMLYGDETSEAHAEWTEILTGSLEDLREILKLGEAAGLMRAVDPRYFHFLIISACEFWASNKPATGIVFKEENADFQGYADFIFDLVMEGLRPRA